MVTSVIRNRHALSVIYLPLQVSLRSSLFASSLEITITITITITMASATRSVPMLTQQAAEAASAAAQKKAKEMGIGKSSVRCNTPTTTH